MSYQNGIYIYLLKVTYLFLSHPKAIYLSYQNGICIYLLKVKYKFLSNP